jgi:hypothetical protein
MNDNSPTSRNSLSAPPKSKVEISARSAEGAEYDSQGQALSEAKRVAPGLQD